MAVQVNGPSSGRGRPKRMEMDVGKIDPKKYNLCEDLVDRSKRRNIIHVADPNIVGTRL